MVIAFSSCGNTVAEYKTVHECDVYSIKSMKDFDKLTKFKRYESIQSVAKTFKNFSYTALGSGFAAYVPIDFSGFNQQVSKVKTFEKSEEFPENNLYKSLDYVVDLDVNGIEYPTGKESALLVITFNADKEISFWTLTDEYHDAYCSEEYSTFGAIGEYIYLLNSRYGAGKDLIEFSGGQSVDYKNEYGQNVRRRTDDGKLSGSIIYESAGNGRS